MKKIAEVESPIKFIEGTDKMLVNVYEEGFYKNPDVRKVFSGIPLSVSDMPLIAFVAFVYDKYSPLRKEDLSERKSSALSLCRFPTATESKMALSLGDDRTKTFVHKYIKAQHSAVWSQYVAFEAAFYNNIKTMMNEQEGVADQEKIGKITSNNIMILGQLEKMKETMFLDDTDRAEEIINFFPEEFVKMRSEAMKKAGFDFF